MSVCAEDDKRYDNCDVADQFVKHFEGFLGISPEVTKLIEDDNVLFEKRISINEANLMIREITDVEIKKALFDIDDNKAPGPDGFTSKFYKKSWDIVKSDFCAAIKEFFSSGKLLREVNATLISLVPKSLTPLKFTICVNRERYGYFKGGRGLRQGDPISLYIFTMVMEILNLIVKNKIRKDNTFKYYFGCTQLKMTHLCFANDLIMLSHGDKVYVTILRNSLNKFSVVSELYPDLGKCTMFCGSLDEETRSEISNIFPFKEGTDKTIITRKPLKTGKHGHENGRACKSRKPKSKS
ncbi:RNA-directed DNA polymerase, eukaryota, reverse transcriptase zinc-binding domain protein [Tanacetum coccineum]